MSTADVLQLDEYRDRRQQRLARTRVFAAPDPDRTALFGLLAEIAGLAGADRVGVVWVDEYGPDHAHPFFVLDYACSPPRQYFPSQPLSRAWEAGVPGTLDETHAAGSTFAVALGSDGARGWFIVADAFTRRARLSDAARERIMFLVGECSAVVLHKDLGSGSSLMTGVGGSAFLRDLDGKDDKPLVRAMIERRFAVGRLGRLMVDEDLTVDEAERVETTRRLRSELAAAGPLAPAEEDPYQAALAAFEVSDVGALAHAMLDIGSFAEAEDHVYGALQAYAVAFDLASRLHDADVAIEAARFSGRLLRRRAQWELADQWYQTAIDIARLERLDAKTALALTGIAGVLRERGNLPRAKETVLEAIELARRSGSTEAVAVARHTAMGVQQMLEEFDEALR
ncbi:MAG: tetratricopeptide repeat protein, partial [Gemmatimonadota bacterium]